MVEEDCVSLGENFEGRRRSVLRHATLATNLIRYPMGRSCFVTARLYSLGIDAGLLMVRFHHTTDLIEVLTLYSPRSEGTGEDIKVLPKHCLEETIA